MEKWKLKSINELVTSRQEEPNELSIVNGEIPLVSKIRFDNGKIELRENGKSGTKLISVFPNDILISGINAQKGAIAINNFNKIIAATIHYSAYIVNENETDREFLYFFLRSRFFQDLLKYKLYVGIKTEIKTSKFLNLMIPFPILTEQKILKEKIMSIAKKVSVITEIREEQSKDINNFLFSYFEDIRNTNKSFELETFLNPKEVQVKIDPTVSYKQVTARWWNNGAILRAETLGIEMSSKQYLVNQDDFIISKIDARHGAYGIIPGELDGAVVTGDFPVFKINGINPNYFDFVSKSNHFLEECKRNSQGTTRRVRLDMNKFLSIAIPVPSPEEQKKVVYLVDKINQIKQKKLESIKELDALLPSVIDKAFKGEL